MMIIKEEVERCLGRELNEMDLFFGRIISFLNQDNAPGRAEEENGVKPEDK